jgi:cation diffusion facilitator CzcD-associated flavoprotein CzcO
MHVTMIQRGKTFVLPVEWLHAAFAPDYHLDKPTAIADEEQATLPNKIGREMSNKAIHGLTAANAARFDSLEKAGFQLDRYGDLYSCLFERFGGHYIDHGASARIARGEIKVVSRNIKCLCGEGLEFEDGSCLPADVIVLATGYDHDFRSTVAKIIGQDSAERMSEYGGLNGEGEQRGFARYSGRKLSLPFSCLMFSC